MYDVTCKFPDVLAARVDRKADRVLRGTAQMATITRSVGRLLPEKTALFVCDIQEKFRPIISGYPAVIDTSARMIKAAGVLGLPVVATEQYPSALGPTVAELKSVLPHDTPIFSKKLFSMLVPELKDLLTTRHSHINQVLLCGIETHICVLQTTLDLIDNGYQVHVLVDAVSSQRPFDRAVALQRLSQVGAYLCTSEMCMFQLAKDASNPLFKQISNLAKEPRPDQLPLLSMM